MTPPGDRDRYAPITFIEPLADNTSALGYDIFVNPEARIAIDRTLELDATAITPRTTLIQDQGQDEIFAFVMYLPVYRTGAVLDTKAAREAAITGWVDVPFCMNDLMEGMRGEFSPDIYVEIHDGAPGAETLMYRSSHAFVQDTIDPGFATAQRAIAVGGREWTLLMNSTPAYVSSIRSRDQSALVVANGVLISLLLSLVVWLMARARYSAENRFARRGCRRSSGSTQTSWRSKSHKRVQAASGWLNGSAVPTMATPSPRRSASAP